ncbi:MAG: hypothetical protein NVS9B12_10290 [Vulcanimicrobiaceae bacterium]
MDKPAGSYRTDQEAFWAGEFGADYSRRNALSAKALLANRGFFGRILRSVGPLGSVMEFGTNIGINLLTLKEFLPNASLGGIELNAHAAQLARENVPGATIHTGSILEFDPPERYDLVLIKGVLIHIDPAHLQRAYDVLYTSSRRYLCIAEYYAPSPTALEYRGHPDRLFKRDFAGEMLDRFAGLQLRDYGFFYRRDPYFPQDDLTWFLLEKRA